MYESLDVTIYEEWEILLFQDSEHLFKHVVKQGIQTSYELLHDCQLYHLMPK